MLQAVLIFSDKDTLTRFLLREEISERETISNGLTLSGVFTRQQVEQACENYKAFLAYFTELIP